jgi:hypothetical protein
MRPMSTIRRWHFEQLRYSWKTVARAAGFDTGKVRPTQPAPLVE